jgi:CBS domain-containing membrane protein
MSALRVRDLMTPNAISVRPDDTVAQAYALMLEHRFRHLVVVDGEGDLVGLVSHRDLLRHSLIERTGLPLSLQNQIIQRVWIQEVMTSEVETVEIGDLLQDAALIMFENKYGCLPVVEGSRPVGILTEADFVRFFVLAGQQARTEKGMLETGWLEHPIADPADDQPAAIPVRP